jgi:hypothetical protein
MRGARTDQVWERSQHRFASSILGPHFERVCREWALYFAGDRFGDWPAQVAAGTVNDPQHKTLHQIDVAVLGHADGARPPLLAIGEAKWNEQMGMGHIERLRRIRDLLAGSQKFDTSRTRLACFSAAGFTDDLKRARGDDVDLISLEDLYGEAS